MLAVDWVDVDEALRLPEGTGLYTEAQLLRAQHGALLWAQRKTGYAFIAEQADRLLERARALERGKK